MKKNKFEEYFLRYKNLVIRTVMKKTGDYQLAQEICQQVFVSLYMNYNKVPDDLVKAWVIRCAQNAVIDYLRKIHARKNTTTDGSPIECGNALIEEEFYEEHIEERMDNIALTGKILREVKAANEQWYEVLMMLCVDGLTYEEVAEKLSIAVPVLRARVYRARVFIRERFGEEYEC